jgi:hypothetical protein
MVGIKPSDVALLVERDVKRVRALARTVITLDRERGFTVRHHASAKPRLSVVAVIGPGKFQGASYDEALLCEVGICRGRPYAAAAIGRRSVAKRRKWFSLSDEQYAVVAPVIFQLIGSMMRERVAKWRSGTPDNPMVVASCLSCYDRRERRMVMRTVSVPVVNGARFSFAYADRRLLADVLWAEWNLNKAAKSRICRLARWIGWQMSHYRVSRQTNGRKFWQLGRVCQIMRALARKELLPHEKIRLVEELAERAKHGGKRFLPRFRETLGEPNRLFAETLDAVLPHPVDRVGGMILKTVRANGRYLTAEVFPAEIQRPSFQRKRRK